MAKLDFKKTFKELYDPSSKEVKILEVPKMNYLVVSGEGNPNTSLAYKESIEALFAVAYAIKFKVKKGSSGIDYGVMPLEGLWWVEDMNDFSLDNKEAWKWSSLMMQPDFVDSDLVNQAIKEVGAKKKLPALSKVEFMTFEEGTVAQIMHVGPYSEEASTIAKLHHEIERAGYEKTGKHHEIYISDVRKTAPEKLKTVIRQPICKK